MITVLVFLAIGLAWLFLNLKAGSDWLKFVSLWLMMFFMFTASFSAILLAVKAS